METILVASRNPAKVERYKSLLTKYSSRVLGLNDVGIAETPREVGETAEHNAEIKARFYAQHSGRLAFSEDEALYADFLPEDRQPGVQVRRINGIDEADDEQLLLHWERIVSLAPSEKRTGKWHVAYSIAPPDGNVRTVSLDHPIIFFFPSSKVRIRGWPLSSLQGPTIFHKPHSELTEEERRIIDRRADEMIERKICELFAPKYMI